jgi:hypothetical protein
MTIVWIATGMQGLAADTKPTNVPTNTSFFETDTGLSFNFNGSSWDGVGGSVASTSNGTYVHSNVTTEEDAITITANADKTVISMDMSLLAQTTTIRVYEEIDGTVAESFTEKVWPTDFEANTEAMEITLIGKGRDQKITFQSGTLEGATRNIPWARRDES